jgi:hypothetical protein
MAHFIRIDEQAHTRPRRRDAVGGWVPDWLERPGEEEGVHVRLHARVLERQIAELGLNIGLTRAGSVGGLRLPHLVLGKPVQEARPSSLEERV